MGSSARVRSAGSKKRMAAAAVLAPAGLLTPSAVLATQALWANAAFAQPGPVLGQADVHPHTVGPACPYSPSSHSYAIGKASTTGKTVHDYGMATDFVIPVSSNNVGVMSPTVSAYFINREVWDITGTSGNWSWAETGLKAGFIRTTSHTSYLFPFYERNLNNGTFVERFFPRSKSSITPHDNTGYVIHDVVTAKSAAEKKFTVGVSIYNGTSLRGRQDVTVSGLHSNTSGHDYMAQVGIERTCWDNTYWRRQSQTLRHQPHLNSTTWSAFANEWPEGKVGTTASPRSAGYARWSGSDGYAGNNNQAVYSASARHCNMTTYTKACISKH